MMWDITDQLKITDSSSQNWEQTIDWLKTQSEQRSDILSKPHNYQNFTSSSPATRQAQQWNSGGDKEQILPAPACEEEPPSQEEELQRIWQWRRTEHRPDTRQEDLHGVQQLRGGQHQHQELQQCEVKHSGDGRFNYYFSLFQFCWELRLEQHSGHYFPEI